MPGCGYENMRRHHSLTICESALSHYPLPFGIGYCGKSREVPCSRVHFREISSWSIFRTCRRHALRPPSLRSRRRSPSPLRGERRRRRRVVHPFGESERARTKEHRNQRYNVATILCHPNFVRIAVRRRGRHPNGPRPPFAGLGRAGSSARAIAPDRGHFRPPAAPKPFDAQKQRSVMDWAQIVGELDVKSLDATDLIEIADKSSFSAPLQIEWRLKNRYISEFWRADDVNSLS